jgi:hypothetical protein
MAKNEQNYHRPQHVVTQVLLAILPGVVFGVVSVVLPTSLTIATTLRALLVALVVISLFFLWLLSRPVRYSPWAVVAGSVALIVASALYGFHAKTVYMRPDLSYNANLPVLCHTRYPLFRDFLLHEIELADTRRLGRYWSLSHAIAGRGGRVYPSVLRAGIPSARQDFPTLLGPPDQGERLQIEEIAGRTGIHLQWRLEEGEWCSMSIETGVFPGVPFQRTFDMDRYQRLSFDVLVPQQMAGNPIGVRLEDDSAIRDPNLKVPCSTNQVVLQPFLPAADPDNWATTPVSIPLSYFDFTDSGAWPHDYDPGGVRSGARTLESAVPDRHHITQVTFGCTGPSAGEMWVTNMRFE